MGTRAISHDLGPNAVEMQDVVASGVSIHERTEIASGAIPVLDITQAASLEGRVQGVFQDSSEESMNTICERFFFTEATRSAVQEIIEFDLGAPNPNFGKIEVTIQYLQQFPGDFLIKNKVPYSDLSTKIDDILLEAQKHKRKETRKEELKEFIKTGGIEMIDAMVEAQENDIITSMLEQQKIPDHEIADMRAIYHTYRRSQIFGVFRNNPEKNLQKCIDETRPVDAKRAFEAIQTWQNSCLEKILPSS